MEQKPSSPLTLPNRISFVGSSGVIKKNGYTKYLIEALNSRVVNGGTHQIKKYCIGDVPSLLGCFFSIRNDVAKSSELALIDFCINDRNIYYANSGLSKQTIIRSLEGIIRYFKSSNSNCKLVFINSCSIIDNHIERIAKDQCEVSILYNLVCDYYKVPIIDVTKAIIGQRGKDYFQSLFSEIDPYHPSEPLGAKIVGDLISDELLKLSWFQSNQLHELPQVLEIENYSNLKVIDIGELESFIFGPYSKLTYETSIIREDYISLSRESAIKFNLKGVLNGIYCLASSTSGYIVIELDNYKITISLYSYWNSLAMAENKADYTFVRFISLAEHKLVLNEFSNVKMYLLDSEDQLENYKFCHCQVPPGSPSKAWTFEIIGITYQGELTKDILEI
jgi:hypothetical protein